LPEVEKVEAITSYIRFMSDHVSIILPTRGRFWTRLIPLGIRKQLTSSWNETGTKLTRIISKKSVVVRLYRGGAARNEQI
jgi:hypothetical protein